MTLLHRKQYSILDNAPIRVKHCDNCDNESDNKLGWPGSYHWADKNFTLCLTCIKDLAENHTAYVYNKYMGEAKKNDG